MTAQELQVKLSAHLTSNMIELRAKGTKDGKTTVLCYKDARCDANRLDEVVGSFNWQREHYMVGDVNYCRVGIRNPETGEWVWKSDAGTESNTEAEKGQASDAFKRACFQWGIGRELYNAPAITVPEAYKFKLKWCKIYLAYFEATLEPAYFLIQYGKEYIFNYQHPKFEKGKSKITVV